MSAQVLYSIPGYKDAGSATARLRYLVLLCLSAALPYNMYFSSMLTGLLVVLTLIDLDKTKFRRIPRQVWIFQGVYLLALAGYFPSLHRDHASFLLERQLSILLLPLVLPLALDITPRVIRGCLWALTAGCTVAVGILFLNALHTVIVGIGQPVSVLLEGPFFNHQFSRPLGIHAGYLSIYVAYSAVFLISVLVSCRGIARKLLLGCCLLMLAAGLVFLAARTVIFATLLIVVFVVPLILLRRPFLKIGVFIGVCAALALTLNQVPYLKQRFTTELLRDISPVHSGNTVQYYTTEPRIERWQAGWELVKDSPWTGYGTGDEIPMLKTRYAKRGFFISYLEDFNAHNQYLSYLIKNGVIGLVAFLGFFAYYCLLAVRQRDFLYISFLLLILCCFYTENVLDANKGILFFAVFNTLLGYSLLFQQRAGVKSRS